jgi:hypothetical protein
VQYCCISSTAVCSTAAYLPLQCAVLLYIFHCSVQYCCISSTAVFSTDVYLPLQCSVLLYIFHCSVQYCCISSTAVFSTAVYLSLQFAVLLYIFHCSVTYIPRDQVGHPSIHSTEHRCLLNKRESAAGREHQEQSHKQPSRNVSSFSRLHNSARRHHSFVNPTKYLQRNPSTLILTLCYKNHLKTSHIHFSLLCQPITAR